jgi:hypothetical protein
LAGALAVDMPFVQRVPNVPAIELARPDFDQTKAAKVVDSISVSGGQNEPHNWAFADANGFDCEGSRHSMVV